MQSTSRSQTADKKEIPQFFLPKAKVVWNGNIVPPDAPSMTAFLESFPLSRHDCQTLDCHPIKREHIFMLQLI